MANNPFKFNPVAQLNKKLADFEQSTADQAKDPNSVSTKARDTQKAIESAEEYREGNLPARRWQVDGNTIAFDTDHNGRFSLDDVTNSADTYQGYLDKLVDDETKILTSGTSDTLANTWDEAVARGDVTQEEADRKAAAGLTPLDARFGSAYNVYRPEGATGNTLKELWNEDNGEYTDWYMGDSGQMVDRLATAAQGNADRRGQQAISELLEEYNPGTMYNPYGDEGYWIIDQGTQRVLDGRARSTDGGTALLDRFDGESEWDVDGVAEPGVNKIIGAIKNSTFNKRYMDEDAGILGNLWNWLDNSTSSATNGGILGDLSNAAYSGLEDARGFLANLDQTPIAVNAPNEDYIDLNGTRYYYDDELRGLTSDFMNVNSEAVGAKASQEEAAKAYNDVYGTDYGEDEFYFRPLNTMSFYDGDGNLVYSGPDAKDEFYEGSDKVSVQDDGTILYTLPNGEVVDLSTTYNTYSYDPEQGDNVLAYQAYKTIDSDKYTPEEILALTTGAGGSKGKAGYDSQYKDIVDSKTGSYQYGQFPSHPLQALGMFTDQTITSLPYMLNIKGKPIGLFMGGADMYAGAHGFDPMTYDYETNSFTDPGLQTYDDWREQFDNVTIENILEQLLGVGKVTSGFHMPKAITKPFKTMYNNAGGVGKFGLNLAERGLEEGVEEALTSMAQDANEQRISGTAGLPLLYDENDKAVFSPWMSEVYDESAGWGDRFADMSKGWLDSGVSGAAMGGIMGGPGAARKAARDVRLGRASGTGSVATTASDALTAEEQQNFLKRYNEMKEAGEIPEF